MSTLGCCGAPVLAGLGHGHGGHGGHGHHGGGWSGGLGPNGWGGGTDVVVVEVPVAVVPGTALDEAVVEDFADEGRGYYGDGLFGLGAKNPCAAGYNYRNKQCIATAATKKKLAAQATTIAATGAGAPAFYNPAYDPNINPVKPLMPWEQGVTEGTLNYGSSGGGKYVPGPAVQPGYITAWHQEYPGILSVPDWFVSDWKRAHPGMSGLGAEGLPSWAFLAAGVAFLVLARKRKSRA